MTMLQPGDIAPQFIHKPVFGRALDLDALTDSRPLALVFLRYIGSHAARSDALALLTRFDELECADIAVAAVTEGSLVELRDFVPRHHVRYPVLRDEDGVLYDAFGVGLDRHPVQAALRALSPAALQRAVQSLPAGHGRPGANWTRLPAALVIDAGRRVAWSWYGTHMTQAVPIDSLVLAALDCAR